MAPQPRTTILVYKSHRIPTSLSAVEITTGNVLQTKFVPTPLTLRCTLAAVAQMSLGNLQVVHISASKLTPIMAPECLYASLPVFGAVTRVANPIFVAGM